MDMSEDFEGEVEDVEKREEEGEGSEEEEEETQGVYNYVGGCYR